MNMTCEEENIGWKKTLTTWKIRNLLTFTQHFRTSIRFKETSRYYQQCSIDGIINNTLPENGMIAMWSDVSKVELKVFFGFIISMGLDQKPNLRQSWSKNVCCKNFLLVVTVTIDY